MSTTTDPEGHRRSELSTAERQTRDWLLRAENVSKAFGHTQALVGASLDLYTGEAVAIMGPSGSGKSTLLHAVAGIIAADEGRVILRRPDDGGIDDIATLSDAKRSAFRLHRFGFVFQQGMLIPELTAVENVALPLMLLGTGMAAAVLQANAELHRLGLRGLGDRRIGQLSGGQAQRVAIARALVTDPCACSTDESRPHDEHLGSTAPDPTPRNAGPAHPLTTARIRGDHPADVRGDDARDRILEHPDR